MKYFLFLLQMRRRSRMKTLKILHPIAQGKCPVFFLNGVSFFFLWTYACREIKSYDKNFALLTIKEIPRDILMVLLCKIVWDGKWREMVSLVEKIDRLAIEDG